MSNRFPLVLLPKRVIYVDDIGSYLDILRKTMPRQLSREFVDSPEAALNVLSQEMDYWRGIEKLLTDASASPRSNGGGEAGHYVRSFFSDWRRFHLTGVLIVDYAMPGLNGLDLMRGLQASPARRVLLTGEADAEVAIQAFNSGLIQKFIPKSTPDLYRVIKQCYEEMHVNVCEHLGHLIRATLTSEQVALLHEPQVAEGLLEKVDELDWIEYVVVGQPFGLLGMGVSGPLQWLQLETPDSLRDVSVAMEDLKYSAADVAAVRSGSFLSTEEIGRVLGLPKPRPLVSTDDISDTPHLVGAVIDLPVSVITANDYGIDDIRSPEEQLRSLMRDVLIADRRASKGDDDESVGAFESALSHLCSTAAHSKVQYEALQVAMSGGTTEIPAELRARIEATVATVRAKGRRSVST